MIFNDRFYYLYKGIGKKEAEFVENYR